MTTNLSPRDTPALAPLTTEEAEDLQVMESLIDRGQRTFVEVGQALAAIRDSRLYRATHGTFEAYLSVRWPEIGRGRAYQLIDAAAVAQSLADAAPELPPLTNERQVRALASVPAAERPRVVHEATKASGGKAPTGAQLQQAARPAPAAPPARSAAPLPPPSPVVLTPITLTPLPSAALALDAGRLQTRRVLRVLLAEALAQLGEDSDPLAIDGAAVATAARLLLTSPALTTAASLLSLSIQPVELVELAA